ncbi:hypothetical protein ACLOJK_022556 [Asimina triloba]
METNIEADRKSLSHWFLQKENYQHVLIFPQIRKGWENRAWLPIKRALKIALLGMHAPREGQTDASNGKNIRTRPEDKKLRKSQNLGGEGEGVEMEREWGVGVEAGAGAGRESGREGGSRQGEGEGARGGTVRGAGRDRETEGGRSAGREKTERVRDREREEERKEMEYLPCRGLLERRKKNTQALLAGGCSELELDPAEIGRGFLAEMETGMKDAMIHDSRFSSVSLLADVGLQF